MKDIRLTTRGKIVFGLLLLVGLVLFYWAASTVLTPEDCRVSVEEMSQACKSLL